METCPIRRILGRYRGLAAEGIHISAVSSCFSVNFLSAKAGLSVWPRHRRWAHECRHSGKPRLAGLPQIQVEFRDLVTRPAPGRDVDGVTAPRQRRRPRVRSEPGFRRAGDAATFDVVDRGPGLVESWPYLHFDKRDSVAAPGAGIDLAFSDAIAASQNPIALEAQDQDSSTFG